MTDKYVETIQQLPKEYSSRVTYFHKRTSDMNIPNLLPDTDQVPMQMKQKISGLENNYTQKYFSHR
jgi:hypothetical protein